MMIWFANLQYFDEVHNKHHLIITCVLMIGESSKIRISSYALRRVFLGIFKLFADLRKLE